jgi:hypothetical protein
VERDVVVRDGLGDLTLEIAHEAGRRRLQSCRHRVHEQLHRLGPAHDAAKQSQLVAANRNRGAGDDHGPPVRGHREELLVLALGGQRRHHELGEAGTDGQLHPRRRRRAGAGVGDHEPTERSFAGDHSGGLEFDADTEGHASEHERHRDEQGGEQREAEEGELDPPERPRKHEGHCCSGEHEPAGR